MAEGQQEDSSVVEFIARWSASGAGAAERANYQFFLSDTRSFGLSCYKREFYKTI
jgi:hypothetical protein